MAVSTDKEWPKHGALTRDRGMADQPKDFDWVAKNIPCQTACPAQTNIPGYLAAVARGDYAQAYRMNLEDNIFPAVLGRVCSRPCEPACRHGWPGLGESVAICFAKRSADDFMSQELVVLPKLFPRSGKHVVVVGAGVGGLAAARNLALWGHDVTVLEKHARPGGMLNQGIPEFRLPRAIIDREIEQVRLAGVDIRCAVDVGRDISLTQLAHDYDAVVLAAGTLRPHIPDAPGCDLSGIQHGLTFMRQVNDTGSSDIAGPVVVIGGGFTAMDCARTAQRLHAGSVQVLYRRSRVEMPVTTEELAELEHEGIPLAGHVAPIGFRGNDDGHVCAVQCVRTEPGLRDASGRYRPEPIAGSEFEVPAATVLLATGQFPDTQWIDSELRTTLVGEDRRLASGAAQATAQPEIFVAGDFALGATTLIDAIGHAKTCARHVDTHLMGEDRFKEVVVIEPATAIDRDMEADSLTRHPMPMRPLSERTLHAEVERGYREAEARQEASRCYLCNYKFEIDNDLCIYCNLCLKHKPVENCIVKVRSLTYDDQGRITGYNRSTGHRDYNLLYIDQNECTRCGVCAEVCPVECIPLQDIGKRTVPVTEFAAQPVGIPDSLCPSGNKP